MRSSTPCSGVPRCRPTRSRRVATTRSGASPTAPTPTARRTANASSTNAAPRATRRRRRPASGATPGRALRSGRECAALSLRRSLATELLGHELGEVGDARPPAADDVVVGLDDLVALDGGQRVEGRTLRQGLPRLLAALGVGEHDEVGRGLHDVLGGELRVPAVRTLGLVGDVLQAELLVQAADEGAARGAEECLV